MRTITDVNTDVTFTDDRILLRKLLQKLCGLYVGVGVILKYVILYHSMSNFVTVMAYITIYFILHNQKMYVL